MEINLIFMQSSSYFAFKTSLFNMENIKGWVASTYDLTFNF